MTAALQVIGGSLVLSRISFKKPAITRLAAENTLRRQSGLADRKQPDFPQPTVFEESSYDDAVAGTGKLRKRKPKMIPKIPNTIA